MTDIAIAARVDRLARSGLFKLLGEGHREKVVDLALGVPGAPLTPPKLIETACAALREGINQYELPDGNVELRRRIAAALPTPTDPLTELTITVGSSEALSAAVLATVNPGDEVIVFEPFYENFLSAIALAGGVPRLVRVVAPDWRYDLAELRAAFGPRTKAVVLCTPNNPTGHMLTPQEFAEIAELCDHWNAIVISDEIYAGYVYDGKQHVSAAGVPALRERSIVIGSLSKSHAVSGWRIGYLRACATLSSAVRRVHEAICGGGAAPLQEAAARAAATEPDFLKPGMDLSVQRNLVTQIFDEVGFRCIPPDGGCYVMADIRHFTDEDGESMAYRVVREAGVMVAPGTFFYSDDVAGARLVRVAFNRQLETLIEAERRLSVYRPDAHTRSSR
ncbi:pyridoxal phosphate-dependent aminotransferase [Streptomyces sp. P9-2B-2]|uniref:pyridoxal phosphate-dependent aminotransferase n=1 Tax=Streptomyces sp. P9-2B-2 TaxID=3057114 RepID=UPI0025B4FF30|nr:pyridoxal phosphate-dependent aminotransferase [Streptomyces sp. P9-2B-2]WJY37095.1 pyridoxal phosphate-dependent aminotransferase [Streptomyces sp. P9-2B-2]